MSAGNKKTSGEKVFDLFNIIFMVIAIVITLYPFWHIVMYSLSDVKLAATGGVFLWPRGFSSDTYRLVLQNGSILTGFRVSFIVTLVGTAIATFFTATTAYPLSKGNLRGRTLFTFMIFFTMLFSGGMIPGYILVRSLGMFNTLSALIIPPAINAWNFFIMRNFFAALPDELEESAKMDGASDLRVFFTIVLPLSKAVMATIALFKAVQYWNDFFSTVLYILDRDKWALQAVLRQFISNFNVAVQQEGIDATSNINVTPATMTMATIVVTTLPIVMVYPFVQKYFVKGVMIGSIKG